MTNPTRRIFASILVAALFAVPLVQARGEAPAFAQVAAPQMNIQSAQAQLAKIENAQSKFQALADQAAPAGLDPNMKTNWEKQSQMFHFFKGELYAFHDEYRTLIQNMKAKKDTANEASTLTAKFKAFHMQMKKRLAEFEALSSAAKARQASANDVALGVVGS